MYEKGANADGRTHKKCRDFVIALGLWFTARARLDRQISKINQFLASDFVISTRFFFQKKRKEKKIQDKYIQPNVYCRENIVFDGNRGTDPTHNNVCVGLCDAQNKASSENTATIN